MKGVRPLTNEEIQRVVNCFDGAFAVRNKCLFFIGVSTGGRISELLSLKIGDVYQNNQPVDDLHFDKSIVKGKETSRTVPINSVGRDAIEELITWQLEKYGEPLDKQCPLFPSRNRQGTKAMTRQTAHTILKQAFQKAGLNGKLATHTLRKSYAQRLYEETNDIYSVQKMLGHKDVKTTQRYLDINYRKVREASEAMGLSSEQHEKSPPVNEASDETLLAEVIRRGYNISSTIRH